MGFFIFDFILDILNLCFSFVINVLMFCFCLIAFILMWVVYLLSGCGTIGGVAQPQFGNGFDFKTRYM